MMRICLALSSFFLLSMLSCSDNQVAGTSSGVDNPSLTVGFTDASGTAARVTGDLDVYAADQNPAVDAEPLATIKVRNSALTLVTGDDFKRAQQAASKRTAAGASTGAEVPGKRVPFNLMFRSQENQGGIVLGLAYDSAARAFSRSDTSVHSVTFVSKPLIRYVGRIAKEPVHGEDCRVFVPGTPFLATLVDSQFILEALPQGRLPLSLIGADGKIYRVADSLSTADSGRIYRPSTSPSGSIDTTASVDTLPDFRVVAPSAHGAYSDTVDILEARVEGISPTDPRLSVHWKRLADSIPKPDSSHHDVPAGEPPPPLPSAEILAPTLLRTGIRFHGEAVFRFLISATVGTRTRSDTAVVSVLRQPPPQPRVAEPDSGDSLVLGHSYNVQWDLAGPGPYAIELSVNLGVSWNFLERTYTPRDGLKVFAWTPSVELTPSGQCLLRVTAASDPDHPALTRGPFSLIR
jgi:hypothetical protein